MSRFAGNARRRVSQIAALAASCVMAVLFTAVCTPLYAAEDPYEINVVLSLTGQGAFLGAEQTAALKVLEQYINRTGGVQRRPVRFVVQDDQSSPQTAVQLTQGLLAKKVPIVLGPTLISTCNAMGALAAAGPVIFCASPAVIPSTQPYVFSSGGSQRDLVEASVHFMRTHGMQRFGLIATTDAGGEGAVRAFESALKEPENKAMTLAATERFNPADIAIGSQMVHLKAADPQAIVLWTAGTPFGTFLNALRNSGLQVPIVTATSAVSNGAMEQFAALLPQSLSVATAPALAANAVTDPTTKRQVDQFLAQMKAAGEKVDYVSTTVWDPGLLIVDAFRKFGPNASAGQIRDWLASLTGWVGINGRYDFQKFPSRGLGVDSLYIARWDAAKGSWVGVSGPGGAVLH